MCNEHSGNASNIDLGSELTSNFFAFFGLFDRCIYFVSYNQVGEEQKSYFFFGGKKSSTLISGLSVLGRQATYLERNLQRSHTRNMNK